MNAGCVGEQTARVGDEGCVQLQVTMNSRLTELLRRVPDDEGCQFLQDGLFSCL